MKRLLTVLFGVLAFQGSVWADSCLQNWPPDAASVTKAKILHPVSANQMIVKKSSFGLAWHERGSLGDFLGANVNIRLYEQGDDQQDLFKNRLINKPNTGFFLINKKDFRTAKVKSGKQYYFTVQKAGTAAAGVQIQSECFTFDIKAKEDLQCNAATNMKECLKVLISQNRAFLERLSELENTVNSLKVLGGVGDSEDSAWLTGGPNGECRHDAEGVWKPNSGMNATKCNGVKWNAANGVDVATNPVCWDTVQFGDGWQVGGNNPWVVGTATQYNNEAYDCRTKCADKSGESFGHCAADEWWDNDAAKSTICEIAGEQVRLAASKQNTAAYMYADDPGDFIIARCLN